MKIFKMMLPAGVGLLLLTVALGLSHFLLMMTGSIKYGPPPTWFGWGLIVGIWTSIVGALFYIWDTRRGD